MWKLGGLLKPLSYAYSYINFLICTKDFVNSKNSVPNYTTSRIKLDEKRH